MTRLKQRSPGRARSASRQQTSRQRNWIIVLLILALVLVVVVGLASIAGYFVLRNQRSDRWTWQDPLLAADASRVRPDIAMLLLAGESPVRVVQESLAAGEPDSAYAALVYSTGLSDSERSGNLQLVANAFDQGNARNLAAASYQQMQELAALSAALPDTTRADSSLAAAAGFIQQERPQAAYPSLAQAEALARYSALLAPAQRQEISRKLVELYRAIGLAEEASDLEQFVRDPQGQPNASLVRGPFLPDFQAPVAASQQLLDAENARRQQALAFVDAWDATGGSDMEPYRAALASALLQEDGVRQAVIAAELAASTRPAIKASWQQQWIDWLTLKLMVARRAVGLSLAPEWEPFADAIEADLRRAYEDLFAIYREQVAGLPNAEEVPFGEVELLRQQILLGRLGLYPAYDEGGLSDQLDEAQSRIADQLPLLTVHEPWGSGEVFRLAESFE